MDYLRAAFLDPLMFRNTTPCSHPANTQLTPCSHQVVDYLRAAFLDPFMFHPRLASVLVPRCRAWPFRVADMLGASQGGPGGRGGT